MLYMYINVNLYQNNRALKKLEHPKIKLEVKIGNYGVGFS